MSEARWTTAEALPGRDHPDASEVPSGRVEAGLILSELEQRGLWVRVETPQGKRLWVDGRRLQAVALAPEPDRPQSPAHQQAEPVPAQPAPKPATPEVPAPVWTATHTVPAEGLQAWAQPDPAGAPTANLTGHVELRIVERRADWAHVDADNGWNGWVDGRRLVALAAPQATQPPPPTTPPAPHAAFTPTAAPEAPTAKSISLRSIAAFLIPISALLPWFGSWFGNGSATATEVPAAFLWSPWTDLSFPNMGTVMLAIGVAVLVTEFMDKYTRYRRITAGVAVGVVALYLIQMFRMVLEYEGEFTTAVATMFTEAFAIGPWVALAAGITLLVKHPTGPEDTGA